MAEQILALEPSTTDVVKIGDRWLRDVDITVTDEKLRRMWQGYECAKCFEPFREAWPDVCPMLGCGFRVKRDQRRYLEERYKGVDEEFMKFTDPEPAEDRAKRVGIWVPRGVNG